MADNFMDHVRLRRVQRRRMMSDVLSAEKPSIGEVCEKDSRLHQTRHRLKPKAADRLHLLVDFTQLRDAAGIETQTFERRQIFRTSVFLMRRPERFPDRLPHAMLVRRVRRIGNRIARMIVHRELGDLISPRAILLIAKAWMIGIELYDRISIGVRFVSIDREHARINVVGKKLPFLFGGVGCHDPSPLICFCGSAAAHCGEALPHRRHSIFKWRLRLRLRRRKAAVVRTTGGSGWLIPILDFPSLTLDQPPATASGSVKTKTANKPSTPERTMPVY